MSAALGCATEGERSAAVRNVPAGIVIFPIEGFSRGKTHILLNHGGGGGVRRSERKRKD